MIIIISIIIMSSLELSFMENLFNLKLTFAFFSICNFHDTLLIFILTLFTRSTLSTLTLSFPTLPSLPNPKPGITRPIFSYYVYLVIIIIITKIISVVYTRPYTHYYTGTFLQAVSLNLVTSHYFLID